MNGIHLGQLLLLTLHHSCLGGLLPELGSVEPGSPQLTGKSSCQSNRGGRCDGHTSYFFLLRPDWLRAFPTLPLAQFLAS